jgi:nitrogen fixation protein FixH
MDDETDVLTKAIANWLTVAFQRELDEEKQKALGLCLTAEGADLQVVARLREGALIIESTAQGERVEIFRQNVAFTGFMTSEEGGNAQ